jgi:cephalosporin hydroxylase
MSSSSVISRRILPDSAGPFVNHQIRRYNPTTTMSDAGNPKQVIDVTPEDVIQLFHNYFYALGDRKTGTWAHLSWMGTRTEKCPFDMWIYQEIIHAVKPQLIIETGTRHGGSALFFCHLCDLLGQGEVITVDILRPMYGPTHPRLTYLTGSSTDPEIVAQVRRRAQGKKPILVVLDSDHARKHVLDEMREYHSLVTPGSYMIVEDTNANGHPVWPEFGPGPMEAIDAFAKENTDFQIDPRCEKFLLTFNPRGFLRKKS